MALAVTLYGRMDTMRNGRPVVLLVLVLVAGAGSGCAAKSAGQASSPTPTSTPATANPGTTPVNVDFTLTGSYSTRITQASLKSGESDGSGLVCQRPNGPISTIFQSQLNGEAVAIQVIAREPKVGTNRGVLVVTPPQSRATPSPSNAFGGDGGSWSTFNGTITLLTDGMSASVQGDLAQGGGPVIENISGGWRCG